MSNPQVEDAMRQAVQLHATGRFDEAEQLCRRTLVIDPRQANALFLLGTIQSDRNEFDTAIATLKKAVDVDPGFVQAHNNLGVAFARSRRANQAMAAFTQVVHLDPNFAEGWSNLGNMHRQAEKWDEAESSYRRAVTLNPDFAEAHLNLAAVLFNTSRIDEAIAEYRLAVELQPANAAALSRLVYACQFDLKHDSASLLREARVWAKAHASAFPHSIHHNDPSPDRRLRIAYVSPNLRDHVVGWNFCPLLKHHHHRDFEIFCYSDATRMDGTLRQLSSWTDYWRDTRKLDDAQLAELARHDQIDILVDLSLHLSDHRLLAFARKPAPVQVTFMGYPGTTGLEAIDYRISDPYLDPPGKTEQFYTERTVRLPNCFWCYDPRCEDSYVEPIGPLPAVANGFITFGCLNNAFKINDMVLDLWGRVLARVSTSKLLMLTHVGSARNRILASFERHGISTGRIEFVGRQRRDEYFKTYNRIDIGLDTLPYAGHTTTLDALWMGVPVLALSGPTVAGRGGASILSNLGMTDWIAATVYEYVNFAEQRAKAVDLLTKLRGELRDRMETSPLMNAAKFTADIEAVYRQMWVDWTRSRA